MNLQQLNIGQLIGQVMGLVTMVLGYALTLLIFAAVMQRFGVRIPYIPAVDHVSLAYLAGAWWLSRK